MCSALLPSVGSENAGLGWAGSEKPTYVHCIVVLACGIMRCFCFEGLGFEVRGFGFEIPDFGALGFELKVRGVVVYSFWVSDWCRIQKDSEDPHGMVMPDQLEGAKRLEIDNCSSNMVVVDPIVNATTLDARTPSQTQSFGRVLFHRVASMRRTNLPSCR